MTLYFISLLTLFLHLAYAGTRVTMSLFALHLGASAATVGVLMSLLAIVPMVFSVKWGRYIDRVGVRGPMYAGLAALLAALVIAFAVPRMEALFVVATLAGSGFMIFHIAVHQAAGLIGKPEDRGRNFSVLAMAWDLFTFVMPIHGSNLGLSATAIGLILGCFGAAVLVVRLVLPLVVHRVNEMSVLMVAMFVTGAALALIPVVEDPRLLMALAFLLGIGLGGAQPMILTLLYNKAPSGRGGEAIGVRTLLLNFAQAGIPLTFGALGAALGMAPVFWLMAFALATGAWYAGRGR